MGVLESLSSYNLSSVVGSQNFVIFLKAHEKLYKTMCLVQNF